MTQESPTSQLVAKFREERFIESDPTRISLIKVGEYVRTPLYEPSIRAMCISLSEVRNDLQREIASSKKLKDAWAAATKVFQTRLPYFRSKFKGPDEYCIALICFTLDEPYKVYQEFNNLCQDLLTNSWHNFPYKGLFYLLIQSEMRLGSNDDKDDGSAKQRIKALRQPITITTDLDYSIEEESESASVEEQEINPSPRVLHTNSPIKKNSVHRAFIGYEFPLDATEFRPRTLVAFSHIMPTTLDGLKLTKLLEAKNKPVTLVEIDQVSWSSRYIASLSLFPIEKEVVIWPWVKFYVDERKMIGKNVEKIVLKPTSRSFVSTASEVESLK